jgi:hypothetical protein
MAVATAPRPGAVNILKSNDSIQLLTKIVGDFIFGSFHGVLAREHEIDALEYAGRSSASTR